MTDENARFASELEGLRQRMVDDIGRSQSLIADAAMAEAVSRLAKHYVERAIEQQRQLQSTIKGLLPAPEVKPYLNGYHDEFDDMPRMFQQ